MNKLRAVVTGGRDYTDYDVVKSILNRLNVVRIYVGDARGADELARKWAHNSDTECNVFRADWETHGKAAGPIRNKEMLYVASKEATNIPLMVVAFPGGRGTEDCIRRAREMDLMVLRVEP